MVSLNERNDSLSKIFGDVFSIVDCGINFDFMDVACFIKVVVLFDFNFLAVIVPLLLDFNFQVGLSQFLVLVELIAELGLKHISDFFKV